ncbi:hypothetical protein P7C70_g9122, partial [Phenoliferia sp. Uapishka_3]
MATKERDTPRSKTTNYGSIPMDNNDANVSRYILHPLINPTLLANPNPLPNLDILHRPSSYKRWKEIRNYRRIGSMSLAIIRMGSLGWALVSPSPSQLGLHPQTANLSSPISAVANFGSDVGHPIPVSQIDHPTMEQMEEVQSRYIIELKRIWDDHKELYASGRIKELTIVA